MDLCQYSNALGEPGKGFHAPRVAGFAVLDVLGTIILAWVMQHCTKWSWPTSLVAMFSLGVLCHRLFCVPTTLDRLLFS